MSTPVQQQPKVLSKILCERMDRLCTYLSLLLLRSCLLWCLSRDLDRERLCLLLLLSRSLDLDRDLRGMAPGRPSAQAEELAVIPASAAWR